MAGKAFSAAKVDYHAIFKGTLVRLLFALHAGICMVRIMDLGGAGLRMWPAYMFAGFIVLMLADACWCMYHSKEWKLFSPTVALYLVCTVPCIWVMELKIYDMKFKPNGTEWNNTAGSENVSTEVLKAVIIPSDLTLEDWSSILLQLMMVVLIIGRWLLPKGQLSRDQLSQLLLVQIATAADILEFLQDGRSVEFMEKVGVILVLSVWSWSLAQFPLCLTQLTKTKKPKTVAQLMNPISTEEGEMGSNYAYCEFCLSTEVLPIFLGAIVMQDLPFLALRLYVIFSPISRLPITHPLIFFACKNAVVLLLQIYRIVAIVSENRRKKFKVAWELPMKRCEN